MSLDHFETREVTFPAEFRNAEQALTDERIMTLLLVPYGEVTYLTKHAKGERFIRGAFRKAAAEFRGRRSPLYLFRSHQHDRAVGKALSLAETPEGPVAEFRIASNTYGDDVIGEYREGLLGAVSVGFRAIRDDTSPADGAREVREAALLEASLLPIGAYEGAQVMAYRGPEQPLDLSAYLPGPPPVTDVTLPWGRRRV
jgi:HK97 family phage prohead protease